MTLTCSAVGASASKIAADLGARDNFGDLAALGADVFRRGGSVCVRHVAVAGLSAMLPAHQVAAIAAGVVTATLLAGMPSQHGKAGPFTPTQTLSRWLASGSGFLLSEGLILSEGFLLSESGQLGSAKTDDLSLLGEP